MPLVIGSTADILIAMQMVARAAPDGYTIALISSGTHAINIGLYAKAGYDPVKDFSPIVVVGEVSNLMIVHPSNPAKTAKDVIAQAKAKPSELTFSSDGNGTSHHLSGNLFASMAGVDTVHVPYKSAPQGITAVMTKEVTMGFFNTPTVMPQIRDGRLKALAATSKTRTPLFPDVPTLDESGLKGYEVTVWFGFAGPPGLPTPILDRLHGEIAKIMSDPTVLDKLHNLGFELMPQLTPAEFGKLIQSDIAKWVPIVKASWHRAQAPPNRPDRPPASATRRSESCFSGSGNY